MSKMSRVLPALKACLLRGMLGPWPWPPWPPWPWPWELWEPAAAPAPVSRGVAGYQELVACPGGTHLSGYQAFWVQDLGDDLDMNRRQLCTWLIMVICLPVMGSNDYLNTMHNRPNQAPNQINRFWYSLSICRNQNLTEGKLKLCHDWYHFLPLNNGTIHRW